MKFKLIFSIFISVQSTVSFALSSENSLSSKIQRMTEQTILTRISSETCGITGERTSLMGGKLELEYDNFISGLNEVDLSKKNISKLNIMNCQKDCTCYTKQRIFLKIQDLPAQKKLEKILVKMNDDDYLKCFKKIKNFCNKSSIKNFIDTL